MQILRQGEETFWTVEYAPRSRDGGERDWLPVGQGQVLRVPVSQRVAGGLGGSETLEPWATFGEGGPVHARTGNLGSFDPGPAFQVGELLTAQCRDLRFRVVRAQVTLQYLTVAWSAEN